MVASLLPQPWESTPLGVFSLWHNNKPRRRMRQGISIQCVPSPSPVLRARTWYLIHNIKTTLGNGYLGSRIDEERSEMRYLV